MNMKSLAVKAILQQKKVEEDNKIKQELVQREVNRIYSEIIDPIKLEAREIFEDIDRLTLAGIILFIT